MHVVVVGESGETSLNACHAQNKQMKIHIFQRFCAFSKLSHAKGRPAWFHREGLFDQFMCTIANSDAEVAYTAIYDSANGSVNEHFIRQKGVHVIELVGGDGACSFKHMLDYVLSQELAADDIVYLMEDDYVHREGWVSVMREAFDCTNASYVSLYDHPDKYGSLYTGLVTQLLVTTSTHWRTTPSTTNTYACRFKTLQEDAQTHYDSCKYDTGTTADHEMFQKLWGKGRILITCIPGMSSHIETGQLSPCCIWNK